MKLRRLKIIGDSESCLVIRALGLTATLLAEYWPYGKQ